MHEYEAPQLEVVAVAQDETVAVTFDDLQLPLSSLVPQN